MNILERERLLIQLRRLIRAGIFPRGDITVLLVFSQCFSVRGLIFLTKMPPAGFVAIARVQAHQFRQFEEIRNATGFFERLIDFLSASEDSTGGISAKLREALKIASAGTEVAFVSGFDPDEFSKALKGLDFHGTIVKVPSRD